MMISKKTFLSNLKKQQKKKKKKKKNHPKNHLFLMMMKMKIFHSNLRQKLQTNKSHKILIKLFNKLKKLNQKSNKWKNLQPKKRKIHCLVEFNKYRKIVLLERRLFFFITELDDRENPLLDAHRDISCNL